MVMVKGGPDIYRLKFQLWTNFVKLHGRVPQPYKWSILWGKVRARIRTHTRAQIISRALKEGREEVKAVAEILAVPDKENIPLSEAATDPVVFKIPLSVGPRSHRKLPVTVQHASENIPVVENISSKENIPVDVNISCKEDISSSEIIVSSQSIVGRHLPGSVTAACVTACEKSSNPRQKVISVNILD